MQQQLQKMPRLTVTDTLLCGERALIIGRTWTRSRIKGARVSDAIITWQNPALWKFDDRVTFSAHLPKEKWNVNSTFTVGGLLKSRRISQRNYWAESFFKRKGHFLKIIICSPHIDIDTATQNISQDTRAPCFISNPFLRIRFCTIKPFCLNSSIYKSIKGTSTEYLT